MHDFLLVFYSDLWSRRNRCRVMSRQTSIHSLQREAGRRVFIEQISIRNAANCHMYQNFRTFSPQILSTEVSFTFMTRQ